MIAGQRAGVKGGQELPEDRKRQSAESLRWERSRSGDVGA